MRFRKWKETEASIGLFWGLWEGITNTLGEIEFTIKRKTTKALVDTGATLFVLKSTQLNLLPWSKTSVQIVQISN